MRKLLLTFALVIGLVLPAVAQFGPGMGRGMMSGDMLLTNKSVQKELKFTEEQTKQVEEIMASQREAMKEAFPLFREDREKATEIMKKAQTEMTNGLKKVREGLTSEQKKRLSQIQLQQALKTKDLNIFQDEAIAKALSLTTKQKDTIKETIDNIAKDIKELQDDAKGDFRKMREMFKKIGELNTEGWESVMKTMTEDQKKALEEAKGEAFELKMDFPGFGKDKGGFGKDKGKGKGKEKKDDF
jgi:Spy/CpxP family protein refolding chaperone